MTMWGHFQLKEKLSDHTIVLLKQNDVSVTKDCINENHSQNVVGTEYYLLFAHLKKKRR